MNKLHWIVRHVNGEQVRENVYGESNALRRLVELNDTDAYIWTPGAYAIELAEAKWKLEQLEANPH